MPAHTKASDVGVAKLGDGSTLTLIDRQSNDLADFHAKHSVEQVRVPKHIRKRLDDYHGMTKETPRWIGDVTYTANHRS